MYFLLFAFWIILNGRFTMEILLLGLVFAAAVYAFLWKFMGLTLQKEKRFWIHLGWVLQYVAVLLKEIVMANLMVLKIVLKPKEKVHPIIVSFPSPLKSEMLQVVLADSITLTPGTITVRLYDNKFEVLLCNITKLKDIVRTLYFFALYDASKIPGFYFYKTDNMKIKFNSTIKKPLCIDGESLDDLNGSYDIKIDHDVYVLMPSKNINSLFVDEKKL